MTRTTLLVLWILCAGVLAFGCGEDGGGDECRATDTDRVAYYTFDTCSSTSPEAMGTGLEATLIDASCDTGDSLSTSIGMSCSSGTALYCNGAGSHADVSDNSVFEPSQFTISAWVYSEDFARCVDGSCTIVSKANTDHNANGYWLMVEFDSVLRLTISGNGEETDFRGSLLSQSTWHHVVATFDGSTATLYLDGVLDVSESVSHGIEYGDESFLIGAMTNRSFDFYGYIDEVALWNYAKTASEVAELYESYVRD